MRSLKCALMMFALVGTAAAQSADPPIADTRLTVHTLLREDIFSGFFDNNMDRVARAEQNIELLRKQRPGEEASLQAWKGGAALQRAVRANDAGKPDEFARYFQEARDAFAAAAKLSTGRDGVAAITGGSYVFFGDRLPKEHRAAAWAQAYDAYAGLWKQQAAGLDQMPVHFQGELLSGMAQSAQRTGRSDEAAQFIDRMLTVLKDTPYEKGARQWKADPASVATTNLTCKNCHSPGRLANRIAALDKQQ